MISIGTSSWHFEGWRGVFYPEALAKANYLAFYARHFNTIEVNTSFYALPRQSTVDKWTASVPDGFTFALKFPRAITHDKMLVDCQSETLAFLDLLTLLRGKAGPALLQLPPSLSRQSHGRALADYLTWLAAHRNSSQIAVEVRARDLMTPAFARFLAGLGFALVLVDRAGFPDQFAEWMDAVATERFVDFTLVRWIGDDVNGPRGDRELTAPRDQGLDRWAERIVEMNRRGIRFFGYMHNPYEGHAPASCRRLLTRLTDRVPLPDWPPEPGPSSSAQLSLL